MRTDTNPLEELLEQYKNAVDISMIVSKTSPKGIITYVNDEFLKISKYSEHELIGKNHNIIRHPDMNKYIFKDLWDTIQQKKVWKGIVKNKAKDGSTYYVDTVIIPILENGKIKEYIGLRNDITQLLESQKLLEKARIDDITSLKSRTALIEDKDAKPNQNLALIDISSFKHINDFYGHAIGDVLLQMISKELIKVMDGFNCQLYRIPIDIFAILTSESEEKLKEKVEEFNNHISSRPIDISNSHIYINTVCGISSYGEGKKIYQNADIALQYAKTHRKKLQIYTKDLNLQKEIEHNLLWTQRLNEAIFGNKVKAFYQPIIDNKTMKCTKFETLVRLVDENDNVVSPFLFLDISKQTKLYSHLTKIVLDHSLEMFKDKKFSFSINLSIEDFENKATLDMLYSKFKNNPISKNIVLEITESEEITNFEKITEIIAEFKSFGCKIAIDDFGSGYSNFTYLMELQADFIKIDGSLIKKVVYDQSSQSIIRSIVSFAKEMGIKTIAEYVSDEKIFNKVLELGIDYSQGFYFGIPKGDLEIDKKLL